MSARIITPDMSPFDRFKVGDTVAHINNGDGVVIGNDGTQVTVRFKNLTGAYDADWFRLQPRFLFHRGDITALPGSGLK